MKMIKFKKEVKGFAALRQKLGYTQQQLANYLGVSRGMIFLVEKGKRSLSVSALLKLAALEKALEEKQRDPG